MECVIQFIGSDNKDRKAFDSADTAIKYIQKNRDKIVSVNGYSIKKDHRYKTVQEVMQDLCV